MYLGEIVEIGGVAAVLERPSHPYTQALLSAVPRLEAARGPRTRLEGDLPSPIDLPSGCAFHTRCPRARDICRKAAPPVRTIAPGHTSACHFADEVAAAAVSAY
jgi:oligopeptide/dipeptide ABC transporter ATP-binding protein